jgi:hypothetical protein
MDFLTQYSTNDFERTVTRFTKDSGVGISSGSTLSLGGGFILLNATSTTGAPCRLRFYSDEPSMITDANRAQGNFNIADSVALVADIVLTDQNTLYLDPPIFGNTFTGGQVWYHLSGSVAPISVDVETYPIKPIGDSTIGNTSIQITASNVPTTGNGVSGSITTSKSFLILTGSSDVLARLRLYSRPYTEIPTSEQSRAFGTEPTEGSLLIADLMFDSASFKYPLVPVLEAYTRTATDYTVGSGQVGYILQNRSMSTANITASLYIYSIED